MIIDYSMPCPCCLSAITAFRDVRPSSKPLHSLDEAVQATGVCSQCGTSVSISPFTLAYLLEKKNVA